MSYAKELFMKEEEDMCEQYIHNEIEREDLEAFYRRRYYRQDEIDDIIHGLEADRINEIGDALADQYAEK